MSLYQKTFNNQSSLNVDSVTTTTINNVVYSANNTTISGYITDLYYLGNTYQNQLNTISGVFPNIYNVFLQL